MGLCDRVAIIRTIIFFLPQPYAGSGDLIGVRPLGGISAGQVKSSQVVGLRDRVVIIRALLHASGTPYFHHSTVSAGTGTAIYDRSKTWNPNLASLSFEIADFDSSERLKMGIYLSQPCTLVEMEAAEGNGISFAVGSMQVFGT